MNRKGDNAEMAIIELVDFNENLLTTKSGKSATAKKTRRGKTTKAKAETSSEETSAE
jgi:large subunit ribosomal protein L17